MENVMVMACLLCGDCACSRQKSGADLLRGMRSEASIALLRRQKMLDNTEVTKREASIHGSDSSGSAKTGCDWR